MANDLILKLENDKNYGRGVWFGGRFLYWRRLFSRSLIAVSSWRRREDKILDLLVFFFTVSGWLAFIF